MKNLSLVALFFIPLLFLNACSNPQEKKAKITELSTPKSGESSSTNQTELLHKKDLNLFQVAKINQERLTLVTGRVVPQNTTQLFAEVQGLLLPGKIPFKEGVSFNKGDILLSLDKREYELNLESQRSSFLNTLTTIMPDLKSDYPDNYKNWLGYINDYNFGTTLDSLPETLSKNEKYYLTTYQIYSQYYAIKAAEERLKKYTIYAPYSGTIVQSNIDLGSLVSPGQPLGMIINRYSYELEAGVSVVIADQLKIGSKITFRSNAISGEFIGTVVRKNNIIDPKTQNIPVYFRLRGKNIKQGMYLEGAFSQGTYQEVVSLPSSAVTRNGNVLILKDDMIQSKSVETLDYQIDAVVVRGLSEGDQVILNNFQLPVVGQKVALN